MLGFLVGIESWGHDNHLQIFAGGSAALWKVNLTYSHCPVHGNHRETDFGLIGKLT